MTKKYEKFEEWMIGKKVEDLDGDVGVVTGVHESYDTAVWVNWGKFEAKLWIGVEDLKFIEESPTKEENVSIPWEVGQVVWDVVYGKGFVSSVEEDGIFPVKVEFDDGGYEQYTLQGTEGNGTRTLFFSEPTIIADTMPPEKPFVPTLMKGDKVVVVNRDDSEILSVGEVLKENAFQVTFTDGRLFRKEYWNIFKLGEEIKFEEN